MGAPTDVVTARRDDEGGDDGAEHGFIHAPERPTHRADDAADAWRRVLAFLL